MAKDTPLPQVVKGDQLSDKAIKERLRVFIPSAIERLIALSNSKQENIALGATKVLLAKVVPDLKAIELKGDEKAPILVWGTIDELRKKGHTGSTKLHTPTDGSIGDNPKAGV